MSTPQSPALSAEDVARRRRMSILAQAPGNRLVDLWRATGLDPEIEVLRGPETGLVALRGRIGGDGGPFQVGEVSATRVSVRVGGGAVGHAMVLGRDTVKARLAAVIDALALDPTGADQIETAIIAPLEAEMADRDGALAAETAATRVNFFTMVRGED